MLHLQHDAACIVTAQANQYAVELFREAEDGVREALGSGAMAGEDVSEGVGGEDRGCEVFEEGEWGGVVWWCAGGRYGHVEVVGCEEGGVGV